MPKRDVNISEAWHRSYNPDGLHEQLRHRESYVKELEEWVSRRVAKYPSLGPDYYSAHLAEARTNVYSDRAAIDKMFYARHIRPMTEKEKAQNERLVELHHEYYKWEKYGREAKAEWKRARVTNPETAWSIWEDKEEQSHWAMNELSNDIFQIKLEWGMAFQNGDMPDDPANEIFSTEMLKKSRWGREEKLACAQYLAAAWEANLRKWVGRISVDGDGRWTREFAEQSICTAQKKVQKFRNKVSELSDPNWEKKQEVVDGEDEMKGQLKIILTQMDEGVGELAKGVKEL